MAELKSCPFCGSANIRLTDVMDFHFVKCDDCGNEGLKDDAEAEAIAAWNRRADATAISERDRRIEALEAEHQEFRLQNDREWRAKLDSVKSQLATSRAECEGLRAALQALAVEWMRRVKAIGRDVGSYRQCADELAAALSQKETGA